MVVCFILGCGGFVFGHFFATLFDVDVDVDVREKTIHYWERKRSVIGTWHDISC